jgi:hypothetical protein
MTINWGKTSPPLGMKRPMLDEVPTQYFNMDLEELKKNLKDMEEDMNNLTPEEYEHGIEGVALNHDITVLKWYIEYRGKE